MGPLQPAKKRATAKPTSSSAEYPGIYLDAEAQRFLVILKTFYSPTWDEVAKMFRLTFPLSATDCAGPENEPLAKALRRTYRRVADHERFLIPRAHWSEPAVVKEELMHASYQIGFAMGKTGLDLQSRKDQIAAKFGPRSPCDHAYDVNSELIVWTRWRWIVLDVAITNFAFSRLQVAALFSSLFDGAPSCSAPVCDGFADYLEHYHKHGGSKLGLRNISDDEHQKAENEITQAAWNTGVNVVYASIEPSGSPRILEQLTTVYRGDAWGSTASPYEKWEEGDLLPEEQESEEEEGTGTSDDEEPSVGKVHRLPYAAAQ